MNIKTISKITPVHKFASPLLDVVSIQLQNIFNLLTSCVSDPLNRFQVVSGIKLHVFNLFSNLLTSNSAKSHFFSKVLTHHSLLGLFCKIGAFVFVCFSLLLKSQMAPLSL